MQFTVDGNKASKCDLRKFPLQTCVCAAFSVLTFVKTWRFFLTLLLGCEGIYVLTLFGLQLIHSGFDECSFFFFWQWCVCWSWSDRRAARPQRATSGGRWPINVDLFTMVGLIAWRYSFFSFFVLWVHSSLIVLSETRYSQFSQLSRCWRSFLVVILKGHAVLC